MYISTGVLYDRDIILNESQRSPDVGQAWRLALPPQCALLRLPSLLLATVK